MHGQTMEEPQPQGQLSYLEVVSIGIGGMVGGGIFAVLGLAVQLAHGGTPEAFFLAGMVALLTSYSYAHLSVKYPSAGGTVEFLNQAFGTGMITGTLNILLWISCMVMLSLYAFAFGSYGASFFPPAYHLLAKHGLISGVVLVFTFINVLGATAVGDSEQWIVLVKVLKGKLGPLSAGKPTDFLPAIKAAWFSRPSRNNPGWPDPKRICPCGPR
jgi:amino acid transporter